METQVRSTHGDPDTQGVIGHLHDLKTWPEYFQAVWIGLKTFEIRKNDREFATADMLLLREYDPKTEKYSGRAMTALVTYITDYAQTDGMVVLGIRVLHRG